jgi:hypothetical protein
MNDATDKHWLTRGQLAEALRDRGFPIGDSTLDKLCAPSCNQGPRAVGYYGRRPLYDLAEALQWAQGRIRPAAAA